MNHFNGNNSVAFKTPSLLFSSKAFSSPQNKTPYQVSCYCPQTLATTSWLYVSKLQRTCLPTTMGSNQKSITENRKLNNTLLNNPQIKDVSCLNQNMH